MFINEEFGIKKYLCFKFKIWEVLLALSTWKDNFQDMKFLFSSPRQLRQAADIKGGTLYPPDLIILIDELLLEYLLPFWLLYPPSPAQGTVLCLIGELSVCLA